MHRDISAKNVVIGGNGYAKLIDCGLSKRLSHTQRTNTTCDADYTHTHLSMGMGLCLCPHQPRCARSRLITNGLVICVHLRGVPRMQVRDTAVPGTGGGRQAWIQPRGRCLVSRRASIRTLRRRGLPMRPCAHVPVCPCAHAPFHPARGMMHMHMQMTHASACTSPLPLHRCMPLFPPGSCPLHRRVRFSAMCGGWTSIVESSEIHRASQTRASTRCRRALPYRMCTSLHPVPTRVAPIVLATRHARCAKGQRPRSCQQAYYRSGRTSGRISSRCAPRASTAVSIGRRSTGWQCRHRFCRSATPTCLHHSEPQSNNRRSTPIRVSNGSQESWVTGFDIGVLGTDDAAHVPQDVKERLHSCAKANI